MNLTLFLLILGLLFFYNKTKIILSNNSEEKEFFEMSSALNYILNNSFTSQIILIFDSDNQIYNTSTNFLMEISQTMIIK